MVPEHPQYEDVHKLVYRVRGLYSPHGERTLSCHSVWITKVFLSVKEDLKNHFGFAVTVAENRETHY